ncbi:MAG: hypothetical protein ACU84J_02890, partial [Gammaproteobacteria bacterium]
DALTDPYPTDSILRRHRESMAMALLGSAKPQVVAETAPVQHIVVDHAPVVPEDSVLRRHYLANLQAEQDALIDPYPTDSILRRHRESMAMALLDSAKPQVVAETAPVQHIVVDQAPVVPEDSVLRRHYFANLQAEQDALTDPYPTDSILRRHRDSMAKTLLDTRMPIIAERISTSAESKMTETKTLQNANINTRHSKRVHAEVESREAPRPTDSILRRHYDSMVESYLDNDEIDWLPEKIRQRLRKTSHKHLH